MRPTSRSRRSLLLTTIALLLAPLVVACSSGDDEGTPSVEAGQPAAEQALEEGRTVIDVRTPEEFNAGHVEGATLIDISGPDFDDLIDALDQEEQYVVYCRTGNRSAVATEQMRDIGLDVLDGGGLEDMAAAGWPDA